MSERTRFQSELRIKNKRITKLELVASALINERRLREVVKRTGTMQMDQYLSAVAETDAALEVLKEAYYIE